MAKAKKLPSGSWRCLVYSHTEKVPDPETGELKDKRIYESFCSDTPGLPGKREAELAAAQFQRDKATGRKARRHDSGSLTLREVIDKYIESREAINRSPTTVQDYRCIQRYAFQNLMDTKIKDIDLTLLQDAVAAESRRKPARRGTALSPKRLKNEWGLVRAVLGRYRKDIDYDEIELPTVRDRTVELPSAAEVLRIIRGTEIELPVLLAAWLSFSMSEIRGLTKSRSISPDGDYITIREVVVDVDGNPVRKDMAKNPTRNRRHRIPPYIKGLIATVDGDVLVPLSGHAIYCRWVRLQKRHGMDPITFHDLRHLNASIMALLRIPDKYAQERGGWKSDAVMKRVYTQTFSEERERVDDLIDAYFAEMQHEMQHGD